MVDFNARGSFKRFAPSRMDEGECYVHKGDPDQMLVAAPHESYDHFTSLIMQDYVKLSSETPSVICEGFREEGRFDVNRPDGKAVVDGPSQIKAWRITAAYFEAQQRSLRGNFPQMVSEIHGKADTFRGTPHAVTEITLIGDEEQCAWTPELRQEIKSAWETNTNFSGVVFGLDQNSYYAHSKYQEFGLAAINHYCGVNFEINKSTRANWDPSVKDNKERKQNREEIINALNAVVKTVEDHLIENEARKP